MQTGREAETRGGGEAGVRGDGGHLQGAMTVVVLAAGMRAGGDGGRRRRPVPGGYDQGRGYGGRRW